MAEESTTRKIILREFKPESYKVWEMSTKATLKYNKLFNIVDGSETDPTPRDDDRHNSPANSSHNKSPSRKMGTRPRARKRSNHMLTQSYSS